MRISAHTGLLSFLLVLLAAAPAHAAGVRIERSSTTDGRGYPAATAVIVYTAAAGEANRLSISVSGETATVNDSVAITPGPSCVALAVTRVRCDLHLSPGPDQVGVFNFARVDLGDVGDTAKISSLGTEPFDLVRGTPNVVTVDAGAGDDSVSVASTSHVEGGEGNDRLEASRAAGRLAGGPGEDRLIGGPGPDVFEAEARADGADTMQGGRGHDTADYSARRRRIRADIDGEPDDGAKREGDRIGLDVEGIEGGSGRDVLRGSKRANTLEGHAGDDKLNGLGGEDRLLGGRDRDRISSRDGKIDLVSCGRRRDVAIVDGLDLLRDCEVADRRGEPRAVLDPDGTRFQDGYKLTATIACPDDAPGRCAGRASFRAAGKSLGSKRFSIARGGAEEVTIRLDPGPLDGKRKLRGKIVVVTEREGMRSLVARTRFTAGDPSLDTAGA